MPIAGKLVNKVNPKGLLVFGLLIAAYSTFMMSQFNLYIDFNTVVWSRIVMGFGLGLVFIPLTNMTLSTIHKEEMGNATSVFNLLRNLGGSFGVATVTTLLARRAQFHQFRFSEYLNPFDPRYQFSMHKASGILQSKSIAVTEVSKNGMVYQQLMRESQMASYADAFYFSTIIMICIIPLILLLKRNNAKEAL